MALKKILVLLCIGSLLSSCTAIKTTDTYTINSNSTVYHYRKGVTPTIIFESGLGDGKAIWGKVIGQLPLDTTVFAYDRPGYGKSDKSQNSRAPCEIAMELHGLLKAKKIKPPYILVAHSIGGLHAYCFDRLYHQDIIGLVMLDPSHPHQWEGIQENSPALVTLIKGLRATIFTATMRKEFDAQAASNNLLGEATISHTPTVFIFSGQRRPEESGNFTVLLEKLRQDWQSRFADNHVWNAHNTGHYIQTENPEIVVKAINLLMPTF